MYGHDGDYLSFEYKLQRYWKGIEDRHPFQIDLLTDYAKNDDGDNGSDKCDDTDDDDKDD